jgi:glycyl-tRNA synthetase
MITFQQLIQKLNAFWEKQGCLIHQGHDLEVGAGTFNPATFLRALGPEAYRAAYVEPSRRPSDGRYGKNPNRVQLFHQYQVVLKPSPPNIQELYLKSLEAIGLEVKKHDIRFVHDDWESPTLGAWGLGWEVWIDGMEASQFTYFQSVANVPLKPIMGEITYGLERLAMYIQGVDNIFDVKWNEKLTFRDITHQSEVEWSGYNFTEASIEMWRRHFDDYEREAGRLAALHHPIPAYDFVIKASHAFNMLDARGAISVTERTGYIARVRELARLIATEYNASREKLGYPLTEAEKEKKKPKPFKVPTRFASEKRSDFLLEIGSEELPATFVPIGMRNLERGMKSLLESHGLSYEKLEVFGTPRRLSILVSGLQEGTATKHVEKRGPAVTAAFDEKGHPYPQGQGFLKSIGLNATTLTAIREGKVKDVEIREVKGSEYLFATVKEIGKSTLGILYAHLAPLILNLEFPKKMRWSTHDFSYARPIHWVVALLGDNVVPIVVGDVIAGKTTFGHAQLKPGKIVLKEAKEYLSALRDHHVIADVAERKEKILNGLEEAERSVGGRAIARDRLIPELLFLSEWPQIAHGAFREEFLRVPQEVLISEMTEHQRYFPVVGKSDHLKNLFIFVADNTPSPLIVKGNERVLSARLSDGAFLYNQDLETPLEKFNEKLELMTFQKELGSMLAKVQRLIKHVDVINRKFEIADSAKLLRAALLSKADLASALVGEFPELQGTIGKAYALGQKEDASIAQAIEEHWMPRAEGAPLPKTSEGVVLSLADKIDNLLGYYSVGLKPTSSSDQYGLRRQTIGIIRILIENRLPCDLTQLLTACSAQFAKSSREQIEEIVAFVTSRAKGVFEEMGFGKEEIEAALQGQCNDPYDQFRKIEALHAFRKTSDAFEKLFEVYKRAKGQLKVGVTTPFNPSLAHQPAEKELLAALATLEKRLPQALNDKNYLRAFEELAMLQPHLAHLFNTVKILDDDPTQQKNRIALLQKVFAHFESLLDFTQLQSPLRGKGEV